MEQTSDFAHYEQITRDVLDGKYLLIPERQTGPSLLYAVPYALFGRDPLYAQLLAVLLSVLQVWLVHVLALHLTGRRGVAVAAALLLAVWPEHILYTNLVSSEVPYSAAVLAAVCLLAKPESALRVAMAGILLGAAHWIRATAPLFWLPAACWVGFSPGLRAARLKRLACLGVPMAILVLPIVAWNAVQLHVVSISPCHRGGFTMSAGMCLEHNGRCCGDDFMPIMEEARRRGVPAGQDIEVFADRVAAERNWAKFRARPGAYLALAARHKIPELWAMAGYTIWSVDTSRLARWKGAIWLGTLFWHKLLLAGAAGVLLAMGLRRGQWDLLQIYVWAALLTTMVHVLMEAQPRYKHMFLPFVAVLAAMAFDRSAVGSRHNAIRAPRVP